MSRALWVAGLAAVLAMSGCEPGSTWTPRPDPELRDVVPVSRLVTTDDLTDPSLGGCTGVVNGSSGQPMAGAEVELRRLAGTEYLGPVATTNDAGQFGFVNVPPGQFTLDISDGNSVRSQGVAVDPAFVSQVVVGQTINDDDDDDITVPTAGFGPLAPFLPTVGDEAVFERTLIEGDGTEGTVTITYTAVDRENGVLGFTRSLGEATDTVTQVFATQGGIANIMSETVNDVVTTYTTGLPVYHDGSGGAALPRDVRGATVADGSSTPLHDRVVLTTLGGAELSLAGATYTTQALESYRTELATDWPRAIVTTTHYAEDAWIVQQQVDISGGGFDTVRGTVLERLTAYTHGS